MDILFVITEHKKLMKLPLQKKERFYFCNLPQKSYVFGAVLGGAFIKIASDYLSPFELLIQNKRGDFGYLHSLAEKDDYRAQNEDFSFQY